MNTHDTGVLAIQHAVANASPGAWRDAIVTRVDQGILLSCLSGVELLVSSNAPVVVGEPVAYHPVAEVLAVGSRRFPARQFTRA